MISWGFSQFHQKKLHWRRRREKTAETFFNLGFRFTSSSESRLGKLWPFSSPWNAFLISFKQHKKWLSFKRYKLKSFFPSLWMSLRLIVRLMLSYGCCLLWNGMVERQLGSFVLSWMFIEALANVVLRKRKLSLTGSREILFWDENWMDEALSIFKMLPKASY